MPNGATLEQIVGAYLSANAPALRDHLHFYEEHPSLRSAIADAALVKTRQGGKFSHQRRVPLGALEASQARLLEAEEQVAQCVDFAGLYQLVLSRCGRLKGIGILTVYDTSLRIGAYLKMLPEHVYLHAGTRVGFEALRLSSAEDKISLSLLPKAFHRLTPAEAEDCLCIYKKHIAVAPRDWI